MTDLPFQTFESTRTVFIGADAMVSDQPIVNGPYVHMVSIKDFKQHSVVDLCLTPEAAVDLRDLLANMLTPTPGADPAPSEAFVRDESMFGPAWDSVGATLADAQTAVTA